MKKTTAWVMLFLFQIVRLLYAGTGGGLAADPSLGTRVSRTGQVHDIAGGSRVGDNLFHSFSEFNVETGETANFQGNAALANIIGRVSGANDSWIDGVLKTTDTLANLYLINPNGLLFGGNARIDIQGSLHISTADYLRFQDGKTLYASLGSTSVLSAPPVEAFGFIDRSPGTIHFSGNNVDLVENSAWNLPDGKDMSIIGGDITIERYSISGSAGRFQAAAVGGAGEVTFNESASPEQRLLATSQILGNIVVRNDSRLRSNNGGDFYIRANGLTLEENTGVTTTFGTVVLQDQVGELGIYVNELTFLNGGFVSASVIVPGIKGGDIHIRVDGGAVMKGGKSYNGGAEVFNSGISSISGGNVYWRWDGGDGGDIRLKAKTLELSDKAGIGVDSVGIGNGGRIFIDAQEMRIGTGGKIGAGTLRNGNGGVVELKVGTLNLDGGVIISETGKLTTSTGTYTMDGSAGVAGDIKITADDLFLTGAAKISSNTYGLGEAGGIDIVAGNIDMKTGVISSESKNAGNGGNAGTIDVNAAFAVNMMDGATVTTSTVGRGNAGDIRMVASDISLNNGAYISSESQSIGDGGHAGTIWIDAKNAIEINGGSHLSTTAYGVNKIGRGHIYLKAKELWMDQGSYVISESRSAGDIGLSDVDIGVDITHTWDSDITAYLISPLQTYTLLFDGVGGDGENFTNTVLDDEAATAIQNGSAPFSGRFQPEGRLGDFDGENPNGQWTLAIFDGQSGDDGLLNDWSLRLDGAPELSWGGEPLEISKRLDYTESSLTISGVDTRHIPAADAGEITMNIAGKMTLKNGSYISTNSQGDGKAGHIYLNAATVNMESGAYVHSATSGSGRAGRIVVHATGLAKMSDGAFMSASTSGIGDAGGTDADGNELGIFVSASEFSMDGASYLASASEFPGDGGDAGNVSVDSVNDIHLSHDSYLSTTTYGRGAAGNIRMKAGKSVVMSNGAYIESESKSAAQGAGHAGGVEIKAGDSVLMTNNSRITTESKNAGKGAGGGIDIRTTKKLYLLNSWITTSARGGQATGGNIFIDPVFTILQNRAPYALGISNSRIAANAHGGPGGGITIITDYLLKAPDSQIEASSSLSSPGTIRIQSFEFDVSGVLANLSAHPLDVSKWQKTPCGSRVGAKESRLVVKGRDAVPTAHDDFLSGLPVIFSSAEFFAEDGNPNRVVSLAPEAFKKNREDALMEGECKKDCGEK